MLSKELQQRLVNQYLNSHATALHAAATNQTFTGTEKDSLGVSKIFDDCARGHVEWEQMKDLVAEHRGATPRQNLQESTETSDKWAGMLKAGLPLKAISPFAHFTVKRVAEKLLRKRIKMTPQDCEVLGLQLTNADKVIYETQSAMLRGEWSLLESLQQKVTKELEGGYHDLKTVLEKYKEHYLVSKPNVTQGSKDDMEVECRELLAIFGNISIAQFNSMESVTKLKTILLKYPLNKQQRFGDKSIHQILKSGKQYRVIGLKTANNYIVRARKVVEYASKFEMLFKATNVYQGEKFETNTAAEDERLAYETEDVKRLIDAICTQPLWIKGAPHPERFWLILIALFHGFRLGNITALTKEDICQTDKGTWIFRLRAGKTKATIRPVAICDSLLLLGFLEWVDKLKRPKLFQDSSRSFSVWYNREERNKATPSLGFEPKYVTTDKGKCLYSLRHNFAGNVFDVTEDFKITSDMMGHSTGRSTTARYTKRTKAETLKEITEKMRLEHIDLDKLEGRAQELFF